MNGRTSIRKVLTIAALTVMWCGLWRTISFANVISGAVLATGIIASGVGTAGKGGIRIVPLAKLLWLVLVDLIRSTIDVAVEILSPTDRTEEAIIAVNVPIESRQHHLLFAIAITLTPGTAVVDADPDTGTLYLHLLQVSSQKETVAHVQQLAQLASEALPTGAQGAAA